MKSIKEKWIALCLAFLLCLQLTVPVMAEQEYVTKASEETSDVIEDVEEIENTEETESVEEIIEDSEEIVEEKSSELEEGEEVVEGDISQEFFMAEARTSKTQDDAIAWANAQVGKAIDVDGAYGAQCVDLIMAYYQYLGVNRVSGNGCDYATNSLPTGWSRIKGGIPQKGDVLVYGEKVAGDCGHVAIFDSTYSTYHQNWNGKYVEHITNKAYNNFGKPYWGVIRPNFASQPSPGLTSDTKFSGLLPLKAYIIGNSNISVFSSDLSTSSGTIYPTDECTINDIYTNGWLEVTYPTSSQPRTAYVQTGNFIPDCSQNLSQFTANARMDTYRKPDLATGFGYVDANDVCRKVGTYGSAKQIIYPTSSGNKLGWTGDWPQTVNNPSGHLDLVAGGERTVRVSGWAYDLDDLSAAIAVHMYVGGPAGSGAPVYAISANTYRSDVNAAYGCGDYHGFESTITVSPTGQQEIYIYAINVGSGDTNPLIGQVTVDIQPDTTAPTISNVQVSDLTSKGYTVTCEVNDAVGIESVMMPTWTWKDGQDDLIWHKANLNGNKASYYVSIADHKNEYGYYATHIYATDTSGNSSKATIEDINVPTPTIVLSNCTATLSNDSYTYDGTEKKPSVVVIYNNTTLTNGSDYTVSYSNNINVGSATVTITGKGGYSGTITKNFSIDKATYDMTNITFENQTVTYDGNSHSLEISGILPNGVTVAYEGNDKSEAGVYSVTANFTGDSNHYEIPSKTATLTIIERFEITSQPVSYTGVVGDTANFTTIVTGADLVYQWQYSNNKGASWYNSGQTGNKTATLTVPVIASRDGQAYRCVITDLDGNILVSDVVSIAVEGAISITNQPSDYTGTVGSTAEFKIIVKGNNVTYQWQYSNNQGVSWYNSGQTGSKTDNLTVPVIASRDGQQYRCIVTSSTGNKLASDAVSIFIESGFIITSQPVNYTGAVGSTAEFTVAAEGTDLTYQWQYSSNKGTSWYNSGQNGNKTKTLTVPVIASRDGQQYRCIIRDSIGKKLISESASITVQSEFEITSQPVDYTGKVGETTRFTVVAQGNGLTYQWQYSNNQGASWYNSGLTGNKTSQISVEITEKRDGQQYRCVIKDASGKVVNSQSAILHVSK